MCVRESQNVVQVSVLIYQTATNFLTKTYAYKDCQPGKSSPSNFRKRYFFLYFWHLKGSAAVSVLSASVDSNVQLTISEMKISFSKIFRHFSFHLRYLKLSKILLGDKKICLDSLYTVKRAQKCPKRLFVICSLGAFELRQQSRTGRPFEIWVD